MKAKKLFTMYGKHCNTVTYEYRGKQYDVEYANNYTYCVTPAPVQHADAQARIDRMIEEENKQENKQEHEFNIDEVYAILGWD